MTDRYAKLRAALAAGPTPGPWKWGGRTVSDEGYVYIPQCSSIVGLIQLADQYEGYQEDCDYIAAADPGTIAALLAERDQLREERDAAYLELRKARRTTRGIYDREVWDRADADGVKRGEE